MAGWLCAFKFKKGFVQKKNIEIRNPTGLSFAEMKNKIWSNGGAQIGQLCIKISILSCHRFLILRVLMQ